MMRANEPFVASFAAPRDGPEAELPVSRLASLGLPVPAGFLILGRPGAATKRQDPEPHRFVDSIDQALGRLEQCTGLGLGDAHAPLFLRLLDTSDPTRSAGDLPLGLAPATLDGLIRRTGQPRYALDCLRRLIALIGCQVHGLEPLLFDRLLERKQAQAGGASHDGLACVSVEGLLEVVAQSLDLFEERTASTYPSDPKRQLLLLLGSFWKHAPEQRSSALLVQAMVFGNSGGRSGAGVLSTRDPASGADCARVDFLINARPSELRTGRRPVTWGPELSRRLPGVVEQLERAREGLERAFGDMVETEFLVEDGQLWFLWAGPAERSARASLRVAHDLVSTGRLSRSAALKLLDAVPPEQLQRGRIVADELVEPLLIGVPTSPGAAAGRLAFSSEHARSLHQTGFDVILFREEGSPSDLFGLAVSRGVLLLGGGRTSRAALMARRMGLPCVVTRDGLVVDRNAALIRMGADVVREGDELTIDGLSGRVFAGRLPVVPADEPDELPQVRRWIHEEGILNHPLR